MPPTLLTITEAAQLVRMHRRSLDRLIASGAGPRVTRLAGRPLIREDDLAAWISAGAGRDLPESDGRRRRRVAVEVRDAAA
ncbi:MAG TPA: helix-turn-helix domain-containing protein [Acetobacteraceae bacterium]|nr:helix-turn-helix domain-containing protein [Acetobacteraceae bacterium]